MHNRITLLLATTLGLLGTTARGADAFSRLETTFYLAVGNGNAKTAYEQMHPALQELVDLPVLKAWTGAVRDNLGSYISRTQTSRKASQQLTGVQTDIESLVLFEQGTATASMRFFNGQLVAFSVQSDQLVNWFQGPASLEPYQETAEAFVTAFLRQDSAKAHSLMHDALKKVVPMDKLGPMMQRVAENGGALRSVQLQTHRMSLEKDRQVLVLLYDIECEKASGVCELEFQFVGMKGHLMGFDFQ